MRMSLFVGPMVIQDIVADWALYVASVASLADLPRLKSTDRVEDPFYGIMSHTSLTKANLQFEEYQLKMTGFCQETLSMNEFFSRFKNRKKTSHVSSDPMTTPGLMMMVGTLLFLTFSFLLNSFTVFPFRLNLPYQQF